MEVGIARRAIDPAVEPRTLFERGFAVTKEFRFLDPNGRKRFAHRRPGPLADADRWNVRRLDQSDKRLAFELIPARGWAKKRRRRWRREG